MKFIPLLFLTFLYLFHFGLSGGCLVAKCGYNLKEMTCAEEDWTNYEIRLKPCPSGYFCQYGQCQKKNIVLKKAGWKADEDKECLSGVRDNKGICRGKKTYENCAYYDQDCDIGLYCDSYSGQCKNIPREGDKCQQTSANHVCGPAMYCDNASQKCVRLYSAKHGTDVDDPQYCESGFRSYRTCMVLGKLTTSEYRKLHDNDDCVYENEFRIMPTCINYSQDRDKVAHCRKYDTSRVRELSPLRNYITSYLDYKSELCGEDSMFCDNAAKKIGSCSMRSALEALYSAEIIEESLYPPCLEQPYTNLVNLYCQDDGANILAIVLGSVFGALFIIGTIIFIYCCKKRNWCKKQDGEIIDGMYEAKIKMTDGSNNETIGGATRA